MQKNSIKLICLVAVLGSLLVALGCSDDSPTALVDRKLNPDVAPDFELKDMNTGSPTLGRSVSPRDYRRKVSAWYFGTST